MLNIMYLWRLTLLGVQVNLTCVYFCVLLSLTCSEPEILSPLRNLCKDAICLDCVNIPPIYKYFTSKKNKKLVVNTFDKICILIGSNWWTLEFKKYQLKEGNIVPSDNTYKNVLSLVSNISG